nr:MAG TPA: hypothetical protein [Caudoviricetes sp.]
MRAGLLYPFPADFPISQLFIAFKFIYLKIPL